MAEARTVRAWARATGREAGTGRGKLPGPVISEWDAEHPEDPYMSTPQRGTDTGGNGHQPVVTLTALTADLDDAFPDPDGGDDADLFPEPEGMRETPPRRTATPAARRGTGKSRGGLTGQLNRMTGKKTPKRPARPRVSVESLLSAAWRGGAKLAAPLPPLQNTLRMQSGVAGTLLEDAVRGTIVDAALQPFARVAEGGKTFHALLGPPVFTTVICLEQQRAAAAGRDPNPVLMAMCIEGLRSGLMAWMDVSGPAVEKALQRERDFEQKYGGTVDDMIGLIFAPPPATADDVAAHEERLRRASQGAA